MTLERLLKPFGYKDKIRLGAKSDGGYVISKNHFGKKLISLGCDNVTTFEEEYLKFNNSSAVIYDGTSKCDIADRDERITFHNNNVHCLSEIEIDEPCMLQMDIEGAELNFFNKDLDKLNLVEQLVLEIHFHEEAYPTFPTNGSFDEWVNLFETLNKYFSLIHIHVNDNGIAQGRPKFFGVYDLLELTYIKKDDCLKKETAPYPVEGLDYPNGYGINPRIDWWLT
jgi:hypothetical protein